MNSAWQMNNKKIAYSLAYLGRYTLAAGIACLVFSAATVPPCTAQIALPDDVLLNPPETIPPPSTNRSNSNRLRHSDSDSKESLDTPAKGQQSIVPSGVSQQESTSHSGKINSIVQPESKSESEGLNVYIDASVLLTRSKLDSNDGIVKSENPGIKLSSWIRGTSTKKRYSASAWPGLRLASFSGNLYSESDSIRYNYTYIGPGIALGRLYASSDPDTPDTADGLFLKLGVSGVSKQTTSNAAAKSTTNKTAPFVADSCGCWAEVNWIKGFDSSLSLTTYVGVQTGLRKSFAYVGLGSLLWF
jgi:hypothetical protein